MSAEEVDTITAVGPAGAAVDNPLLTMGTRRPRATFEDGEDEEADGGDGAAAGGSGTTHAASGRAPAVPRVDSLQLLKELAELKKAEEVRAENGQRTRQRERARSVAGGSL